MKYFVSLSDGSCSENLHSCKHISLTAFEMNSIIFKDRVVTAKSIRCILHQMRSVDIYSSTQQQMWKGTGFVQGPKKLSQPH